MAATLELQCPNCETVLQLDAGFAGGVCRCSSCTTLMTVPADPQSQAAEKLSRPSTPGGAPGRPEAPGAPAEMASSEGSDEEVYTTDSGKVIRIGAMQKIPMAPAKKKLIRATTAIIFGGILFVVLAAFIAAIMILLNQKTPEQIDAQQAAAIAYQRNVDPYTLNVPNALGLPLTSASAVIVDASYHSDDWLTTVNAALAHGLTRGEQTNTIALIYTATTTPRALPGDTRTTDAIQLFQQSIQPQGEPSIAEAVRTAKMASHFVLILGRELSNDELDEIQMAVAVKTGVKFDIVMIDKDDPDLDDYATRSGGHYVMLGEHLLASWSAP